jgi:ABC-type methionine transport system ATPase subunit
LRDEAASSPAPQTTSSIPALIDDLMERLGLRVVPITRGMKLITEIRDRVAVME